MPRIITRSDAKRSGLKTYYTGKPCSKGHLSRRNTNSADCIECNRIKNRSSGDSLKRMKKRDKNLKDRYGISLLDYQNLLLAQDSRCALCRNLAKELVVDHCHTKGNVRGLLCNRCNNLIGLAEDNPNVLQHAIDYLLKTA